ncbi:MAG: TorF family putative porin, partial [Peristeroidobacter soli]
PALQGSADYAFSNGLSIGAWASNVDFGYDADIELDVYLNYVGKINDTFSWTGGFTYYSYPGSDDVGEYPEFYLGLNAGAFSFKQWYADKLYDGPNSALYSEANYTASVTDSFSLAFHAGYAWGDAWDSAELFDYAVQANYVAGKFTLFAKFTGTDASGEEKFTSDENNNEPRFLVGVTTTLPWGK